MGVWDLMETKDERKGCEISEGGSCLVFRGTERGRSKQFPKHGWIPLLNLPSPRFSARSHFRPIM